MGTRNTTSSATAPAHTPGPWHCEADEHGFRILEGGRLIAQRAPLQRNPEWQKYYVPVARLLAAAPELLHACKVAYAATKDDAVAEYLDEVIARAEGR